MIFRILRLVLCIAGVYVALATGCEYRSFRGGHRYIRAFRAKTRYQHFFTLLQCEKDIHGADMGKLTYLGYTGVLLATAAGLLLLLLVPYLFLTGNWLFMELAFYLWAMLGMGWGFLSVLLQVLDGLLNRFF